MNMLKATHYLFVLTRFTYAQVSARFFWIAALSMVSLSHAQVTVTYIYDDMDRLRTVMRSDDIQIDYNIDTVGNIGVKSHLRSVDTDGDGLSDSTDLDDDNDGMPDSWELQFGFNPLIATDAMLDTDGDGQSNINEFRGGFNPLIENIVGINVPVLPFSALLLLFGSLITIANYVFKYRRQLQHTQVFVIVIAVSGFFTDYADADPLGEGWHDVSAELVTPAESQAILTAQLPLSAETSGIENVNALLLSNVVAAASATSFPPQSEFSVLVHALDFDPVKIYQYVLNTIDYTPYYGFLKGAELILIEQSGNDFDQAALLVALLREAGFLAEFRYGSMSIPMNVSNNYDMGNWLGIVPTIASISKVLAGGGIPVTGINSVYAVFDRAWVQATVNGQVYQLDPAFKQYKTVTGIDLKMAMGYSQADILSVAGGTVEADSVQNLNYDGLSNKLSQLSKQLTNYIKENEYNSTIAAIIGSREIVQQKITALPNAFRFAVSNVETWAVIPHQYIHTLHLSDGKINHTFNTPDLGGKKISVKYGLDTDFISSGVSISGRQINLGTVNPADIPIIYKKIRTIGGLGVSYASYTGDNGMGIIGGNITAPCKGYIACTSYAEVDFQLTHRSIGHKSGVLRTNSPTIFNQRHIDDYDVTVTVGKGESILYLDDTLIEQHSISLLDNDLPDLVVSINHPYAANDGSYADQTATYNVKFNGTYTLVTRFGNSKTGELLARRQRQLNKYIDSSLVNTSHEVISESLNVMGQTWMRQTTLSNNFLANISNVANMYHHRIGMVGQEKGYFIDVPQQVGRVYSRDLAGTSDHFLARNLFNSGFEHGALEQLQKGERPAVSTIKLLKLANDNGQKIYDVDKNNINDISPLLLNYSNADKQRFSAATTTLSRLILPEDGNIELRRWSGAGYIDYKNNSDGVRIGMKIDGGYMGGYGAIEAPVETNLIIEELQSELQLPSQTSRTLVSDPVDLATGAFVSDLTDIAFGSGGVRGVTFARSYDSRQATQNSVLMGKGWIHNYKVYAREHSDVLAGIGGRQPRDAVAMLVAATVALDLMNSVQPSLHNWMTAALVANWSMDQLLNNAVSIDRGTQVNTFIKIPNGAYSAPPGSTLTLSKVDNKYIMEERFGTTYIFRGGIGIYRISIIKDINGNTLNFSYNGRKLSEVKDTYGRTLNLHYVWIGANYRLASVTDFMGRTVNFTYTGEQLTQVTGLDGAVWQYSYDTDNQLLTTTNPEGDVIVDNTYDNLGRVVQQISPRVSGGSTYNMYYGGTLSVEVDPAGGRTTYFYDKNRKVIAVENALGNVVQREYDGQGQLIQSIDALNNKTLYTYDNDNNLRFVTDALNEKTEQVYDEQHRLIRSKNALGNSGYVFYNEKHQPVKVHDAVGNEAKTSYLRDGLVETSSNPKRVKTAFTYDEYGQVSTKIIAAHPPVSTEYDSLGRLKWLTDQAGATTEFTVNNRGLVTARKDALDNQTSTSYSSLGSVVSQTDRNGDTATMAYTPTGKVASISYPAHDGILFGFVSPAFTVDFAYDALDRLSSMTDQQGTTQNQYDTLSRLTGHTDPNGHQVSYQYDANSNVTQLTYPDGNTVSYQYDALNRISNINIDALNKSASPSYDAAGRLINMSHFNNTQTNYHYDKASRLLGVNHQHANGSTLADYEYKLDVNGNRYETVVTNEPIKPLSRQGVAYTKTYNAEKNRVETITTGVHVEAHYDDEGQMQVLDFIPAYEDQPGAEAAYTYDAAHRLAFTAKGSNFAFYHYDGMGNRLSASRNGVLTQYIYDAGGNLLAEANSEGEIQKYFVYGATGLIAMVNAQSGELYVYHFDGTGHTVAMTNSSSEIVNRYAYAPFGVLEAKDETVLQPFTYAGQVGIYTEANNLYYMRARYYNAEIAQFISEDPAGFVDGPNLYAYATGNPIRFVDPTGFAVYGVSFGGGISFWGLAFGGSITLAVDSDFNFAAVNTLEVGLGTPGAGVFARGLYGGGANNVQSLEGLGVSLSGQLGSVSASVTQPLGNTPPIYELGIGTPGIGVSTTIGYGWTGK